VAVVGKLVQKQETGSYIQKRNNTQNNKIHRILHKTENKRTKQKTNFKRTLESISQVVRE
jgi:hypothetical protein